ncbi:MAG TPA: class I SAM-dependent methyltransferase, partial [Burkholderiaceae bacterium]|nr:class I SAM-dependent methyltransferase [Burkholderiaceae bacterium]
ERPLQDWPGMVGARLRWTVGNIVCRRFDERYGVETIGVLRRDQMQTVGAHGGPDRGADFVAVPERTFLVSLSRIPENDFSEFAFIDFGCGKGRTILLAAANGNFDRVVGVEHAPALVEVAQRNLRTWRGERRCQRIDAICADAFDYELPPQPFVLYMCGPFGGDVVLLQKMFDRISASLAARPRRAYLIFVDGIRIPLPDAQAIAAGFAPLTPAGGDHCFDPGTLTTPLHFGVYRHEPQRAS